MEWKDPPAELSKHVVICNCSEQVRRIVGELHSATVVERPDVVLVVQDAALWKDHPEWQPDYGNEYTREHFFVLIREGGAAHQENLVAAHVRSAKTAIILADPRQGKLADARSTLVALALEQENPDVHTVMELISSINREHLRATAVDEVVCVGEIAERLIAQSCITPGVKNVFESVLINAPGTNNIYITKLPKALAGTTYRDLVRRAVGAHAPFVIVGFIQNSFLPPEPVSEDAATCRGGDGGDGQHDRNFVLNPRQGAEPGRDTPLAELDQLVVIAYDRPKLEPFLIPPGA
jgi:Trk K+ transport system NAD-binding subunit